MQKLEERVANLEENLIELSKLSRDTALLLKQTQEVVHQIATHLERLEKEIHKFAEEMDKFKNEMLDFKNEMKDFKDEMLDFKEEMRRETKKLNKMWGDLARKTGKLVEDIIAPGIRPLLNTYFNCDPEDLYERRFKRSRDGLEGEFDVVAVCGKRVFLVEVKSYPRPEDIPEFHNQIERFRKLFPEYKGLELIPIFASVSLEENIVNLCTKNGFYAMAYREWEYLDLLNYGEVRKKWKV